MAEIELSALVRQCLDRRLPNAETLLREVQAWQIGEMLRLLKFSGSLQLLMQGSSYDTCNQVFRFNEPLRVKNTILLTGDVQKMFLWKLYLLNNRSKQRQDRH